MSARAQAARKADPAAALVTLGRALARRDAARGVGADQRAALDALAAAALSAAVAATGLSPRRTVALARIFAERAALAAAKRAAETPADYPGDAGPVAPARRLERVTLHDETAAERRWTGLRAAPKGALAAMPARCRAAARRYAALVETVSAGRLVSSGAGGGTPGTDGPQAALVGEAAALAAAEAALGGAVALVRGGKGVERVSLVWEVAVREAPVGRVLALFDAPHAGHYARRLRGVLIAVFGDLADALALPADAE